MAVCGSCGTELEADDLHCPGCGQRVIASPSAPTVDTMAAMDISEVQYRLGMVYFKKGTYDRAIAAWENILVRQPDNAAVKKLVEEARACQAAEKGA